MWIIETALIFEVPPAIFPLSDRTSPSSDLDEAHFADCTAECLQALLKMGIRGVTVTEVRGFGAQGGSRERQAGISHSLKINSRVRM
jgi:hypothetical protein